MLPHPGWYRGIGASLLAGSGKPMIHLYLVRHGIAEDAAAGVPDLLRTLTEKARRRFRKTARSFGRQSGALDLILASPLVRAGHTAEILAGEVKHAARGVLPEVSPH